MKVLGEAVLAALEAQWAFGVVTGVEEVGEVNVVVAGLLVDREHNDIHSQQTTQHLLLKSFHRKMHAATLNKVLLCLIKISLNHNHFKV